MRTLKRTLGSAMAMACVLGLATTSMAQNNNLDEVGAALALPVITHWEDNTVTYNVVTNVSSDDLVLHVNVINGYDWSAFNFSCYVTASETTLFKFRPLDGYNLRLSFECTNPQTGEAEEETQTLDLDSGIMFVALEDPQGGTVNENAIFGDAVVISFGQGYAWSVGAVSFQGGQAGVIGVSDRDYRFDGMEYSNFPSVLATNFIAPTGDRRTRIGIDAELILFTLDGTTGISPGPDARLSIIFYNDDERPFSTSYAFSCFSIVRLTDIDSRFQRGPAYLDSASGHMFMTPQITTQTSTTHDFLFDGPASNGFDGQRRTPVHGWLVQTIHRDGIVCDAPCEVAQIPVFESNGAWARTLNQSTMALSPSVGDVPVLSTVGNP